MIRDNQRYFNRLHVVFDALVIALSYVSAWFLKFSGPFSETSVRVLSFEQYMSALLLIVPGFLILYYAFNFLLQVWRNRFLIVVYSEINRIRIK